MKEISRFLEQRSRMSKIEINIKSTYTKQQTINAPEILYLISKTSVFFTSLHLTTNFQ